MIRKLPAVVAVMLAVLALSAPASAGSIHPESQTCYTNGTALNAITLPNGGSAFYTPDQYGPQDTFEQCVTNDGANFNVTESDIDLSQPFDEPDAYPDILVGCIWYTYSCSSGWSPIPTSDFTTGNPVEYDLSATPPDNGNDSWDLSEDGFLTPDGVARSNICGSTGQELCPQNEIMIWFNSGGGVVPGSDEVAQDVKIGSFYYNVYFSGSITDVSLTSFQMVTTRDTVKNLSLSPFIKWGLSGADGGPYLNSAWELSSTCLGYELWVDGVGASVNTGTDIITPYGSITRQQARAYTAQRNLTLAA
jgi:hypothetical protein